MAIVKMKRLRLAAMSRDREELLTLLQYLQPSEADHYREGSGEVKEMLEDLGIDPTPTLKKLFGTDVEASDED